VAQWDGAKRVDNSPIWYGVYKGGRLTGSVTDPAIIPTTCASNGTCTRQAFELAEDWVRLFVLRNSTASISSLSHEEFGWIAQNAVQRYESVIGTNDPDLSAFRYRGGKIIGFLGTVCYNQLKVF
jgi:feruloyl esterase